MAKKRDCSDDPPFRSMIRANGQAEVWNHFSNGYRISEPGWRCGTNEGAYELETLMGNWLEERRDLEYLKVPERLPSQYGHYFQPIYDSSYNTVPTSTVPPELRLLNGRHPHSYPHHQPELDGEKLKAIYNSWETTYRADYLHPSFRKRPVIFWDQAGPSRSTAMLCSLTQRGE